MKTSAISLSDTLAGKEYAEFLNNHGFSLVLDDNGDDFSCTVFRSDSVLIAFTYQRQLGENLVVAEPGASIDPTAIEARKDGWFLIGEVWQGAYQNFHKARKKLPYPHQLSRGQEIALISEALNSFMARVDSKQVLIGKS